MNTLIKQSTTGAYSVTEIDIVDEEKIAELENSKLVFTPEFIPYYLNEVKKYKFNEVEGLIYGFIRFFLSSASSKFYFTNKQLGEMFGKGTTTISVAMQKVVKCGEFRATYRIKANGGKFRMLENCMSDYQKIESQTIRKLKGNKNKIKENNINIYKNKNFYQKQENTFNEDIAKRISDTKKKQTQELLSNKSQYEILKSKGIV